MKGWRGKVLRVDLTNECITQDDLDPQVAKEYIGGRGLGIYYLNKEVDPTCDPLSPDNLMCFFTGPLTGTRAPTGARYMVSTKSPLSGALTTSNSGGQFPTEMKRAGFDGMIFTGKSKRPVYLFVGPEGISLRPAEHLWGKDTHQTTDMLLEETDPGARVACIGPAGERLVLFASIQNDKNRSAGRSGVGAVMGSKNLKAVVVKAAKREVPVFDEEGFKSYNGRVLAEWRERTKVRPEGLSLYGTTYGVGFTDQQGTLPTKNFQYTTFAPWKGGIQEEFHAKYFVKRGACFACPMGCTRISKLERNGVIEYGEGPEYETWYALGSNCMVSDLSSVIEANFLCNRLGMDTMEMGGAIACAMELVDRGLISETEVGRSLNWGDGEALVELTRKTGLREGFGNRLAEGPYRLAKSCGHPEYAMVSKKQTFAGYEPRRLQGMGLCYATSPIGASHMRGDTAYFELFGTPVLVDASTWKDKPELAIRAQNLSAIIDSLGLCIFVAHRIMVTKDINVDPVGMMEYVNLATGANYSLEELWMAGERIFNAERLFLTRAGFSNKDDVLPPRELSEPLPDGPGAGAVCHLQDMVGDYYRLRGWTSDGVPQRATLERLGLAS